MAALDTGNVNLALPFAPANAENEIRAAFAQSHKVRALGSEAKTLADRAFVETIVRLHRAGEGAAYTGLKPAGVDYGPTIPAAERALETANLREVKDLVTQEVEHGLHARFARAVEDQKAAKEPKTGKDIPAARERVSAEFGFVTYVEGIRQAAHGAAGREHRE